MPERCVDVPVTMTNGNGDGVAASAVSRPGAVTSNGVRSAAAAARGLKARRAIDRGRTSQNKGKKPC